MQEENSEEYKRRFLMYIYSIWMEEIIKILYRIIRNTYARCWSVKNESIKVLKYSSIVDNFWIASSRLG